MTVGALALRIVIGWLIVGVLVIVLIYIIGNNVRRMFAKLTNKEPEYNYVDEFLRRTEYKYNRAHLPSTELPPLAPDWSAVNEFILKTRFRFNDNGDNYIYRIGLVDTGVKSADYRSVIRAFL